MQCWQIGSEFHWSDDWLQHPSSQLWLPQTHTLFASATAALINLVQQSQQDVGRRLRLHLPSYYCMNVPLKLQPHIELAWYQDIPSDPAPNFATLQPTPGDLVLAVNFFGVRSATVWKRWQQAHPAVICIEDHSHDIASPWALQSTADYCVASLYKTLPVPDGGLLWSPAARPLPTLVAQPSTGTELRFAAMLLKQAYLQTADHWPNVYRTLELQGIDQLESEEPAPISVLTQQLLPYLNLQAWRQQRAANVQQFIAMSRAVDCLDWQPLFQQWDAGAVPFNGILVCRSETVRDQLRQYLIQQQIFPAIHWSRHAAINPGDPLADDLAQRILTLPLDQRYQRDDVDRILQVVQDFFQSPAVLETVA